MNDRAAADVGGGEATIPTATGAARPVAPWHLIDADDAAARLGSSNTAGLAAEEAARRLARDGPNELRGEGPRAARDAAASSPTS